MRSLQGAQGQRRYAWVAACLGWFGLAVQQYLILIARWADHASLLGGLVRFFSFFTVLTNVLVAMVLTCALSRRDTALHRLFRNPALCSGVCASIALVGIAYNLLLRHLWQPQGWQWLADELLHDIMPLLFVIYWWLYVPKANLRARHVLFWMLYPVGYFGYVLLRGDVVGDYLYPIIDVGTLGFTRAFINAGGVLAGFVAIAGLVLTVDRLFKKG